MHSMVLQDWTTVRGGAASTITQGEREWLDMEPYESFVAWLETRDVELGGAPGFPLVLESAPLKDERLFQPSSLNFSYFDLDSNVGVKVISNLLNAPSTVNPLPLTRWLRWRIAADNTTSTWTVTFRVLIAAYSTLA